MFQFPMSCVLLSPLFFFLYFLFLYFLEKYL
nr:MAG TPA: hypothetical protein [Caudoviricetes sp.]